MTIKRRKTSGQSTAEFALMMPVIMLFFFWIFQVNIYYSALNQSAWAAYAGARTNLVMGGPDSSRVSAQRTVDRILTGRLFRNLGNPQASASTLRAGGGPDGIILRLQALDTLPYVSNPQNPLLNYPNTMTTHLGWQEYNPSKYPDTQDRETGPRRTITDNNLLDY